jgi:hypothetical protein
VSKANLPSSVVTGNVTRAGTGAPASSLGTNGDNYLDVLGGTAYGPKQNLLTPGAFPSSSVVDAFARPGENPLSDGGSWSTYTAYAAEAALEIITSGQATTTSSGSVGGALWTAASPADVDAYLTVAALGASDFILLWLRVTNASTLSGYRIKFTPTTLQVYLATGSLIGTTPVTVGLGDQIGARMSGTTLTVYHQPSGGSWTQIFSVGDATYTTGYVGVSVTSQTAAISNFATGAVSSSSTSAWPAGVGVEMGAITAPAPTGVSSIDGAAIAACLTQATAVGYGKVFLQPGTYVTNQQLYHPSGVVIEGCGSQVSVIQAAPGLNVDVLVTAGFMANTGTANNGPSGFGLRHLTIDGNRTNQTSKTRCWVVYGYNYTVHDVQFINGYGGGVYSEWGGPANPSESLWSDVKIWDYGGMAGSRGFDWNGPHDSKISNVIIATLDSTIKYTDSSYGATPINGSTTSFPGPGVQFTFVTTSAAPTAAYPTSGGSFVVRANSPAVNSVNAPATISYTAASTSGSVTTFTGCTCPIPSTCTVVPSDGTMVPTYGMTVDTGSGSHAGFGLVISNSHVWGRHHFAWYLNDIVWATNCYAEGGFIASYVPSSACSWIGGTIQANESAVPTAQGALLGSISGGAPFGVQIVGTWFSGILSAGYAVNFVNDGGGNVIRGVTAGAVLPYTGTYASSDTLELYNYNKSEPSLFLSQAPANGASAQVFVQQSQTITNVSITGSVVTITTAAVLGLINGNGVYVSGITGVTATTLYTVSSVSGTSFTITQSGASWTSGGTITQGSFTWAKPAGCTAVQVICVGGGGGGQAGALQASGTIAVGGSGGGGGGYSTSTLPTALVATSAVVAVGSGGPGATANATNSSNGTAGTSGGVSSFTSGGSVLVNAGGGTSGSQTTGGGGGLGITQIGPTGGPALSTGLQATTSPLTTGLVGAGGAAGGLTTAAAAANGQAGSTGGAGTVAHGAAGTAAPGGNGSIAVSDGGGGGGGGGAANASGNGYAGGNGGNYGAGGGGGGAALNGSTSGAAGSGAPGIVIVSTW